MNELNINETSILLSESKLYRESLDNCQPSKSNKQKEALLSLNSVIIPWLGRQDGGFRHLLAVLGNRGSILPRFLRSSFTEPNGSHPTNQLTIVKRPTFRQSVLQWLGRQSLFQTFDDDPDLDINEIRELLTSELDDVGS